MRSPKDFFEETWFYARLGEVGESLPLPENESHHLLKVLRLRPGIRIAVTNGVGKVFLCDTQLLGKDLVVEAVDMIREEPMPPKVSMVLALLKGKDTEDPVEALCQLNLAAIHLVTTDHTQEFKGQDHSRLVERLRVKSLVALKQAKKAWLTEIHPPKPLKEWRSAQPGNLVVVHPGEDNLPEESGQDLFLLTGPEGGFSPYELSWLNKDGNYRLGLGGTRIKGAHAPLLACGKLMGMGRL